MVRRVLLLLNLASGTGQGAEKIARVQSALAEALPKDVSCRVELIEDHPAAKAATMRFSRESVESAALIVGGGGGTLRAAVEGICEGSECLPGKDRIRLAPLRLGSGNVVAKKLRIPLDPEQAVRQIGTALQNDATTPCCIIRCDVQETPYYAVTMAGFGQFGRAPGDLVRWHRRLAVFRKWVARVIPLEKLNDMEYLLAMLIRSFSCAIFPSMAEMVDITFRDQKSYLRLFSGVLLNFRIPMLPFDPQTDMEDEAFSLYLLPLRSRRDALLPIFAPARISAKAIHFRIEKSDSVEMRFVDRKTVEFFLDEDPMFCSGSLRLRLAGTLAFIPGFEYGKRGMSR